MNIPSSKGFTLIELLIVIAVVAILAAVVLLVLNPAELLRRARDSNRISDIAMLRTAFSLYLANVSVPNLASSTGSYNNCYMTFATTTCGNVFGSLSGGTTTATSSLVNGAGWLPVNFTAISSGAPLGKLPIDPLNNANFFYAYAATSTNMTFKIVATGMESVKYGITGPSNVVSTDGGIRAIMYEVGTNLAL